MCLPTRTVSSVLIQFISAERWVCLSCWPPRCRTPLIFSSCVVEYQDCTCTCSYIKAVFPSLEMLLVNVTVLHSVICLLADADQYPNLSHVSFVSRLAGRRELVISHSFVHTYGVGQGQFITHPTPSLVFPFSALKCESLCAQRKGHDPERGYWYASYC